MIDTTKTEGSPTKSANKSGKKSGNRVGLVSLGCPKALVDSERILTQLRSEGYGLSDSYADANAVIVNTCGFLDSAKEESLNAIKEAMAENGKVIVTGCMGVEEGAIREVAPDVIAVTGPQQYEQVVEAVRKAAPQPHDPFVQLVPEQGLKLTPRHYSYVKISEGCNHTCKFCIIPSMRGKLASRPLRAVMREAEKLVDAGTEELLIISQDTSAYGLDLMHGEETWRGKPYRAHLTDLCKALGSLDVWVRLHYVYPYPHVDDIIPLMAEGLILPYLDIPFQHASPRVLRSMARPANEVKVLERLARWRAHVPEIAIRSTFIVGYPGETEEDFTYLLDWLEEAQLDRVGCFTYEPVEGAAANALADPVPEPVKQERQARFMAKAAEISAQKLQDRIGYEMQVLIDDVGADGAVGRTYADAPEIDGLVHIHDPAASELVPGTKVMCHITDADSHDLTGTLVADDETTPDDDWDW